MVEFSTSKLEEKFDLSELTEVHKLFIKNSRPIRMLHNYFLNVY